MELEIRRFQLGLSAADRDRLLLSIGKDPVSMDPNRCLSSSYAAQVFQISAQLAILKHVTLEDEILSVTGLEKYVLEDTGEKIEAITGSEIHENTENRTGLRWKPSSEVPGLAICELCRRKQYSVSRVSNEESALTGTEFIVQNLISDDAIWLESCPQIVLHALLLDYLKALGSQRRKVRITNAATKVHFQTWILACANLVLPKFAFLFYSFV